LRFASLQIEGADDGRPRLIGIVVFHRALWGSQTATPQCFDSSSCCVDPCISPIDPEQCYPAPNRKFACSARSITIAEHILTRQAAFAAVGAFGRHAAILAFRPQRIPEDRDIGACRVQQADQNPHCAQDRAYHLKARYQRRSWVVLEQARGSNLKLSFGHQTRVIPPNFGIIQ
jgi:hypothetical protein